MKNILAAVAKALSSNSTNFWIMFTIFMVAFTLSFASGLLLAILVLFIDIYYK